MEERGLKKVPGFSESVKLKLVVDSPGSLPKTRLIRGSAEIYDLLNLIAMEMKMKDDATIPDYLCTLLE